MAFAWVLYLQAGEEVRGFFVWNAACQFMLFAPVVCLPAALTGHLWYVDIGWPCGLVILAANVFWCGGGWWLRRYIFSVALLVHGLRMTIGAVVMFGQQSGFTYQFKEDLPRYRFAKVRWLQDGMSASSWSYKIQHDALQQCYANIAILAAPFALAATDGHPNLRLFEVIGLATWGLAWIFESTADAQKLLFLAECQLAGRDADEATRAASKSAVLGHPPYNGRKYVLWTLCRHPNYFGEFTGWFGFSLAGIPSVLSKYGLWSFHGWAFLFVLLMIVRLFYDCLLHWTGAAPAEFYSVQKRPKYREYQRTTRCFFPFDVPLVDHFQLEGWPVLDSAARGH